MNSPVERSANIWANRREQHPDLGTVYVFTPEALALFVDSLSKSNEPSQYGSAELQTMIVARAIEKASDQEINNLVVEYADATDQLDDLGMYVDYDPDVGRVPEHWVANPAVVAVIKHVLAALASK